MMAHLLRALARLEAHWTGDLIGVVSVCLLLFAGLWIGAGAGLQ